MELLSALELDDDEELLCDAFIEVAWFMSVMTVSPFDWVSLLLDEKETQAPAPRQESLWVTDNIPLTSDLLLLASTAYST